MLRLFSTFHGFRRHWFAALLILPFATHLADAAVRVVTWDLQPKGVEDIGALPPMSKAALIQEAAGVLKALNPDVIILQQVQDWQNCTDLARALRPADYKVAVCSAFRDPRTGGSTGRQVAILTRGRAYLAWSEAWNSKDRTVAAPGGYAFAALRMNGENIGVFSVQLGDGKSPPSAREEAARQLVQQLELVRNWTTNRIQTMTVAGDFNAAFDTLGSTRESTLAELEKSGLANTLAGLPLEKRITLPANGKRPDATVDYIFTSDAVPVGNLQIMPVALSEHYPVSCDLYLNGPVPLGAQLAGAGSSSARARWSFVAVGILAGVVLLGFIVRSRARRGRLQTAAAGLLPGSTETALIVAPPASARRMVIVPQSTEASSVPPGSAGEPPLVHIELGGSTHTESQGWQQRDNGANAALRQGLLPHISRWLKGLLVRRLVSDRAELLETQQVATMKALAMDERLAKVETHIQQRQQEYEKRIDDLLKELSAAREENRELIRARIALVRAEMERDKARARSPQRDEDQAVL